MKVMLKCSQPPVEAVQIVDDESSNKIIPWLLTNGVGAYQVSGGYMVGIGSKSFFVPFGNWVVRSENDVFSVSDDFFRFVFETVQQHHLRCAVESQTGKTMEQLRDQEMPDFDPNQMRPGWEQHYTTREELNRSVDSILEEMT